MWWCSIPIALKWEAVAPALRKRPGYALIWPLIIVGIGALILVTSMRKRA